MKGLIYISAIDGVLDEYRYTITNDDYTFKIEKRNGIYGFLLYDNFKQMRQMFHKDQVKIYGLEMIADELENIFLNGNPCGE